VKCADCGRTLYRGIGEALICTREGCSAQVEGFMGLREFSVLDKPGCFELTPLPVANPAVEWQFKLKLSFPHRYREMDCEPLTYAEVCQHNVCKVEREGKPFWFGYIDIEGHGEGYWLLPRVPDVEGEE